MIEDLERALRSFDANAFADRHGGYKESRSSRSHEWLIPCPWCGSDRLRWRHQPGVKMAWVCWGCGRTGETLDLVQGLERCDRAGAIGYVLDGYVGGDAPVALDLVASMPTVSHRPDLEVLPRVPYPRGYEAIDVTSPVHFEARRYLHGRGVTDEMIAAYRIGTSRSGWLKGYVIFPCFMDGGLVYWQGRATWDPPNTDKERRRVWVKQTNYRKTLNPYGEEAGAGASFVLFNFDRARAERHVVVCEGPIDAVKVGLHAVALLGKVPSPTKVERLLRMSASRYTVYLDRGEEERAKALELARQLHDFAPTFIATPPPGYDPGKLSVAQNAAVIAQAEPYRPAGLRSRLLAP